MWGCRDIAAGVITLYGEGRVAPPRQRRDPVVGGSCGHLYLLDRYPELACFVDEVVGDAGAGVIPSTGLPR